MSTRTCTEAKSFAIIVNGKTRVIIAMLSVVAAAYCVLGLSTLEHGSSSIAIKPSIIIEDAYGYTDILFMTMGESKSFKKWYKLTRNLDIRVTLFFASYDSPVHSQDCEDDVYCQTLFIPHTTWTEGRNLLAEEAVYAEATLGKKYKYWAFMDDDVQVRCTDDKWLQCWNKLVNYIYTEMPPNAAVLALPLRGHSCCHPTEYHSSCAMQSAVSTFDAFFNVIRRENVPILLPYVTMPKGSSEWTSQAALFSVMRHCLKSAAVYPGIVGCNKVHLDYIKGINEEEIQSVLRDNYGSYMQLNSMSSFGGQGQDQIGPFNSTEELNQNMRALDIGKCEPLVDRFAEWEKKALDPSVRTADP